MSHSPVTTDVTTPTLYVCDLDMSLMGLHPCTKADAALEKAGIAHEKVVYGSGRPLGIGTKGKRPDLAAVSGQEKLPVLVVPGGEVIAGSAQIVAWARSHGEA